MKPWQTFDEFLDLDRRALRVVPPPSWSGSPRPSVAPHPELRDFYSLTWAEKRRYNTGRWL